MTLHVVAFGPAAGTCSPKVNPMHHFPTREISRLPSQKHHQQGPLHTTAPTTGTHTHQTTAPTAGASTHLSTAPTAGAPTHQSTAPRAGELTHQSFAPTAGSPTHQSAAPTAGASSEQCVFESFGTPSQPASTPTQATDQHYTTAPLSETIDLSPCEGRSVYSTKPDGRCFFRSVVVALEPTLQVDTDNGSLPSPILMLQEMCKADALRSNVIWHCLQQYDSLSDLMTGDCLNADMPSHIRYTCLHDRLNAMADPRSRPMVGELEISQTAEVLNTTSNIVNKDSDNVLTYGEEFADPMRISLLYTPLGNCAGHYDTLRKSNPSEQLNRIPCSPVLGLSLPTLQPKKNSKRKRSAEILTSSPYKKSLEQAAAKKVKKTKPKATRTQANRKPKSKQTHGN